MRILVTGGSGWIGSAVIPELLTAGHQVVGLARSDASAQRILGLGAEPINGSLDDIRSLQDAAANVDGVIHLGYNHDFSQMAQAAETDRKAIDAFAEVLAGTDGPLAIASGLLGLTDGAVATERDAADPSSHPRNETAQAVLDLSDRGIRSMVVRFAPTVHGPGDGGFMAALSELARRTGRSGYLGDGANRWAAVHRLDAASLVRLAVEKAPAGSVIHAVADEGIATREIAEALGRSLDVPTQEVAAEHFGWIGRFFGAEMSASSTLTRELTGWIPTHPGLVEDIAAGSYVSATPDSAAG